MNALHPFREGNGRIQREFIKSLSAVSGHELSYAGINEKEMLEASIETFDLKYDKMEALLQKNMKRLPYKEQLKWCEKIAPAKGEFSKAYKSYFRTINRIADDIAKAGFQATDNIVRKMEQLHRATGKELTVKEVHGLMKSGADEETPKLSREIGKEFAAQERNLQVPDPGPEVE